MLRNRMSAGFFLGIIVGAAGVIAIWSISRPEEPPPARPSRPRVPVAAIDDLLVELRRACRQTDVETASKAVIRIGQWDPPNPEKAWDVYYELSKAGHSRLADVEVPDGIDWDECLIPPTLRPRSWSTYGIGHRRIAFALLVMEALRRIKTRPAVWLAELDPSDEVDWHYKVIDTAARYHQKDIAGWAIIGVARSENRSEDTKLAVSLANNILGDYTCSAGILWYDGQPSTLRISDVTGSWKGRTALHRLILRTLPAPSSGPANDTPDEPSNR